MKFVIRRALLGVVSIPLIAGAYVFLYLLLVLAGGDPTQTISETFFIGIQIASVVAVILTFYPQFSKFVNKLI
jgi:hypothetical protein